MILAFDTYYFDNKAKTVCIAFAHWADAQPERVFTEMLDGVADYEPGAFYKRELPCILNLLTKIPIPDVEAIVIDGFVYLDDNRKPGLGAHLYNALQQRIPVIGVAKTNFATIEKEKQPVWRGKSERPLFITAAGITLAEAAACMRQMSGAHRIPDLLKQLDGFTKEGRT
jgi:deoxyribonuclease V